MVTLNGKEQFQVTPVTTGGRPFSINTPINTDDIKTYTGAGVPFPTLTQVSSYTDLPAVAANVTATGSIGVSVGGLSVLTVTSAPSTPIVLYSFITGTGISPGQKITNQITPLISGETSGGKGRYGLIFPEPTIVASTTVSFTTMGYYDFYLDTSRNLLHAATGQRGSIMTFDVSAPNSAITFVGETVRLNTGSQGNSRYLTFNTTDGFLYMCTTTGSYLTKWDLSGGGVPALVGSAFQDTTNLSNISDIQFVGTTGFALCYNNSTGSSGVGRLTSLDCSSWPPTVTQSITSTSLRFPSQLGIIGNFAIAAGPWSGSANAAVTTWSISNPAAMVLVATSDTLNRASALQVVGNYVYTTSYSTDLSSAYLDTFLIDSTTGAILHVNRITAAISDGIGWDGGNYLFIGGRVKPLTQATDKGSVLFIDISVRASPKLVYQSNPTYVEPRAYNAAVAFSSGYIGEDVGNSVRYVTLNVPT